MTKTKQNRQNLALETSFKWKERENKQINKHSHHMLVRTVATQASGRRCTELEGEKGSIPVYIRCKGRPLWKGDIRGKPESGWGNTVCMWKEIGPGREVRVKAWRLECAWCFPGRAGRPVWSAAWAEGDLNTPSHRFQLQAPNFICFVNLLKFFWKAIMLLKKLL